MIGRPFAGKGDVAIAIQEWWRANSTRAGLICDSVQTAVHWPDIVTR